MDKDVISVQEFFNMCCPIRPDGLLNEEATEIVRVVAEFQNWLENLPSDLCVVLSLTRGMMHIAVDEIVIWDSEAYNTEDYPINLETMIRLYKKALKRYDVPIDPNES